LELAGIKLYILYSKNEIKAGGNYIYITNYFSQEKVLHQVYNF